jgi:(p)ppGpp synthase/HD superfamily hydrolase
MLGILEKGMLMSTVQPLAGEARSQNTPAALSALEILAARQFALKWHAGQMWGDLPYIEHLDEVAELLASRGAEVWQIVAAYLHDILEDPKCPESEILRLFGQQVLDWVVLVSGFGTNRKEKQKNIVDKLRQDKTGAARLKLADRLVNVRKCVRDGNIQLLKMYRKDAEPYGELFAAADAEWAAELNRLLEI